VAGFLFGRERRDAFEVQRGEARPKRYHWPFREAVNRPQEPQDDRQREHEDFQGKEEEVAGTGSHRRQRPGQEVTLPSLIRRFAVVRRLSEVPIESRYNTRLGIAEIFEDDRWVPSTESTVVPRSKKADIETGEDQKGE
jgi:hypothetical protein